MPASCAVRPVRRPPLNSLALVLIARDEARCIQRCLDSARAWVDEICVLDTGSVDDTVAIARRCGARVAHAIWADDFSAARNAALAMTDAPWRLVLDADEWIAGSAECLNEWRDAAPASLGAVCITSVIDGAGQPAQFAPSWLPRLLPLGVRYDGRVHEQPQGDLPRRRVPLQVWHDGYAAVQMQRKQGRNRKLLQRALAEQPHDAYPLYQLGKDHELAAEYASAEACYAPAMALAVHESGWYHDLLVRRLFTLKKLQRFAQAMKLAEAELPHWSHSPDFFFTLGDLLLDWAAARPRHAATLLPMIEASWRRALDIGENPQLADRVVGRGSYLAAHNLGVFFHSLGDATRALAWRERAAALRAEHDGATRQASLS